MRALLNMNDSHATINTRDTSFRGAGGTGVPRTHRKGSDNQRISKVLSHTRGQSLEPVNEMSRASFFFGLIGLAFTPSVSGRRPTERLKEDFVGWAHKSLPLRCLHPPLRVVVEVGGMTLLRLPSNALGKTPERKYRLDMFRGVE